MSSRMAVLGSCSCPPVARYACGHCWHDTCLDCGQCAGERCLCHCSVGVTPSESPAGGPQFWVGAHHARWRPQETDLSELRGLVTQLRAAGQRLMAATDRGPALHALEDLAYSAARQAHDAASDHAPDSDGDCTAGCVEDWPCTPLRRAADTARAALNVIHNC